MTLRIFFYASLQAPPSLKPLLLSIYSYSTPPLYSHLSGLDYLFIITVLTLSSFSSLLLSPFLLSLQSSLSSIFSVLPPSPCLMPFTFPLTSETPPLPLSCLLSAIRFIYTSSFSSILPLFLSRSLFSHPHQFHSLSHTYFTPLFPLSASHSLPLLKNTL